MESPASGSLALSVTPRRGRLLITGTVMLGILITLTCIFLHGVSVFDFDTSTKSREAQNKMLDNYNSYSGNIASILSKPIEIFTTVAVQLVILSFLANAMATPSLSWKMGVITLITSASIGYLVRNGISALNVQFRPREVEPYIGAADLSIQSNTTFWWATQTTTVVTPEMNPNNVLSNTLLRNLVYTPPRRRLTQCDPSNPTSQLSESYDRVADTSLQLGIPQREWQSRLLSKARAPTKRMRIVVNSTTSADAKTTNQGADLPMNATRAADLFMYGMIEATRYLPWGVSLGFVDQIPWNTRFPMQLVTGREVRRDTGSMADFTGLLPPESQHANESSQRTWFLIQLVPAITKQFSTAENTSRSDVHLEFSHLNISASIEFDALTMEIDVDPMLYAQYVQPPDGVRYMNIDMSKSCGPWPGLCFINKPPYSASVASYDAPSQVRVFSPCVDEKGNERLTMTLNQTVRGFFPKLSCPHVSNTSLYVVSIAKRVVAESMVQNKSINATGIFPNPQFALATNLRKIYSFTIGRLAWQVTDLADAYNAECDVSDSPTKCLGLQLPLEQSSTNASALQTLVVGADALPLSSFTPYEEFLDIRGRMVTLARLIEPSPLSVDRSGTPEMAGDLLFPHNIGQLTWDKTLNATPFECSATVEDRLRVNVENHFYSEHSLQPAYTAATFFLFQNAMTRDAMVLSGNRQTLAFAGNVQDMVVLLSIPKQNAWLTLAGCIVLILCLVVVLVKPMESSDPLLHIMEPHAVARVLLDEKQFPPLLLQRRIVGHEEKELKDLVISSIALGDHPQTRPSHTAN